MGNPLLDLHAQGQSVWLDYIRRNILRDGTLRRYMEEDGIRGVTANPTIFAQAIGAGDDYDAQIGDLLRQGVEPSAMFEHIAVADIGAATDIMRTAFDATNGADGFVSIEVSPEKAYQTQESIDEAKHWRELIGRPNLMVKIPATDEGVPAIEECLFAGLNINITLIFALAFYEEVMEAYLRALERRAEAALDLGSVNSVASFFVSRVDTAADKLIEAKLAEAPGDAKRRSLEGLLGKVAVANAKVAYRRFSEVFASQRFKRLEAQGAKVQRPLWASTGTKNPRYSDILYVAELIGPHTVNTMPPQTIDAFRDHGSARRTIDEDYGEADLVLRDLADAGISLDDMTEQLQKDGVKAFAKSFQEIGETTAAKADQIRRRASAA
ncbi:MAG: transaldolase [Dehalococcoidia bacterium]